MAANTTTSAAILKSQYTQQKVYWIAYQNNPAIASVRKDEAFVGDFKMVAVQIETPQGGGITVPIAQLALAPGVYKRFQLTRRNDYALARVTGEAMKAAEGDDGALIQLWTREMDGSIHTIRRSWAIHWFRNGTGSRGQVSAGSNVSNAFVTLARVSDITNFAVGMPLQFANTDGGTLRSAGANITVTTIDRLNGILGFAAAVTGSIAAAQAGDFLLRSGDLNGVIQGMNAWTPTGAITNTLFNNLDRTSDPVRLGGQGVNAQGMSLRELLIEQIARIDVEAGEPDVSWFHPRDKALLAKELEGKSVYFKEVSAGIKGSDASISYDVMQAEFDGKKIMVRGDLNCPRGNNFTGQWSTMGLDTLGPFPHIVDYDTLDFVRVYNDDSFEVRVAGRGDVENLAPAFWAQGYNVGS